MEEEASQTVERQTARFGWKAVAVGVTAAVAVWAVFVSFVFEGGLVFVLPVVVLYAVILLLLRRGGRSGPITMVVVSLLLLAMQLSFGVEDLFHPESWRGFMSAVIGALVALVGLLAGIALLRGWEDSYAERVGITALAVAGLALVLGMGASSALQDDVAQPGDVHVAARDIAFVPPDATATPGTVSVFVENDDPVRHTFTVRALGVEVELPADTNRRLSFEAPPGSYDVICSVPGHEGMRLTLTVGG